LAGGIIAPRIHPALIIKGQRMGSARRRHWLGRLGNRLP
jgi:hypothetical protein